MTIRFPRLAAGPSLHSGTAAAPISRSSRPAAHSLAGALAMALILAAPAHAVEPAPGTPSAAADASAALGPASAEDVLGLWIIEQARSAPLVDKRSARLNFGPGGVLSGNGSCNAIMARYTLEGQTLKIGPVGTTRKACSDALLEQEDRVLTALERAARAAVPPHGFLTLWDADGAVLMRASRPGAEADPKPKP